MTAFETEEKTTKYRQSQPQKSAFAFAPSAPYSATTQQQQQEQQHLLAPQQQQQHAGYAAPISPTHNHATAYYPHAAPGYGYPSSHHHAYTPATTHYRAASNHGGGAYATPSPHHAAAVPSNAVTASAHPPKRAPSHDEQDDDHFVQELVVDWTAELDDRLLQWARYCHYDWNVVGQHLQLPAFICEHRYDTLRRRDRVIQSCRSSEQQYPPPRGDRSSSSQHYYHRHHHHHPRDGFDHHREYQVLVRNKSWSTGTSHCEETGKVLHASSTPTTSSSNTAATHSRHERSKESVSSIVSRSSSSDTEESKRRKRMVDLFADNIEKSQKREPRGKAKKMRVADAATSTTADALQARAAPSSLAVSTHKSKEIVVTAAAPSERTAASRPTEVDAVFPEVPPSAPPTKSSSHRKSVTAVEEALFFFRLFWQGSDECLGFLTLPADATFADARKQIAEQLDDSVNADYQFLLEELGPVSRKQEAKLGPIMEWLGTENVDAGSRTSPIKLKIVAK